MEGLPGVAGFVDSGIRLAAVSNVEERLEPLDAIPFSATPDCFGQRAEGVVGNDGTAS